LQHVTLNLAFTMVLLLLSMLWMSWMLSSLVLLSSLAQLQSLCFQPYLQTHSCMPCAY